VSGEEYYMAPKSDSKLKHLKWVIGAVLVPIIIVLIQQHPWSDGPGPQPSPTSTAAPTLTTNASQQPSASPVAPSPLPSPATFLSDLNDEQGYAVAEPLSIKGKTYINSIHYGDENASEGLEQKYGRDISLDYDISAAHYHSFDATVGFFKDTDDPAAVVLFAVKVDSVTVASKTCSRYAACPIHADLPAGSQLTLYMKLVKSTDTSQKLYFPDAYPAWGNARLR
jgi:hypothetical protein